MSSSVKWIKLSTQMFEDEKIRLIESMPEADTILIIWVKLLAQAGKTNASGYIYLAENIPFTDEMLATIFNRSLPTVRLALRTLEQFGMIEITEDHMICISNWEKHQNIEGLERIREQNRIRKRRQRELQKLSSPEFKRDGDVCQYCGEEASGFDHIIATSRGGLDVESNKVPCCERCNQIKMVQNLEDFLNWNQDIVKNEMVLQNKTLMKYVEFNKGTKRFMSRDITGQVTGNHATDIDKEKEEEVDKEKEKEIPFKDIISYLNDKTSSNYKPSTKKTKNLIRARWNEGFTLDDFKHVIDVKVQEWLNNREMSKYLRPETLFGTKFESYLNQKGGKPGGKDPNAKGLDLPF